jgi:hypothetical protein
VLPTTPERCTHDYVRHGTPSLFDAYDPISGPVIAKHHHRHRYEESLLIDTTSCGPVRR